MVSPQTEAGNVLVRRELWEWLPEAYQMSHARLFEVVESIEAEARHSALVELRAEIEGLPFPAPAHGDHHDRQVDRADVLALIDRHLASDRGEPT